MSTEPTTHSDDCCEPDNMCEDCLFYASADQEPGEDQ